VFRSYEGRTAEEYNGNTPGQPKVDDAVVTRKCDDQVQLNEYYVKNAEWQEPSTKDQHIENDKYADGMPGGRVGVVRSISLRVYISPKDFAWRDFLPKNMRRFRCPEGWWDAMPNSAKDAEVKFRTAERWTERCGPRDLLLTKPA